MGISDHLTCLLRNLYAGQEATVRTGHGTTDWFKIGKGVHQGCILSACLFNLYAVYSMRNAGLEETQAGIKIARRNINHLRYADDNLLWEILKEMRIPDHLLPEKPVFRSRGNSQNQTWNNDLVQNRERSTSRLYIVSLLI